MWVVRELLRLLEKIAIAFVVALAFAAIQAPLRGHGHFLHGLQVSCLIVGALLLLMAAMGRGTMFERRMDSSITQAAWGRIPGVNPLEFHPEDPTLTPGAVFGGAAVALIALGIFV